MNYGPLITILTLKINIEKIMQQGKTITLKIILLIFLDNANI